MKTQTMRKACMSVLSVVLLCGMAYSALVLTAIPAHAAPCTQDSCGDAREFATLYCSPDSVNSFTCGSDLQLSQYTFTCSQFPDNPITYSCPVS